MQASPSTYQQTVWIEIPHTNLYSAPGTPEEAEDRKVQQTLLTGLEDDIEKTWNMLYERFKKYFALNGSVTHVDFFRGIQRDRCGGGESSLLKVVMGLSSPAASMMTVPIDRHFAIPVRWYPLNNSPSFPGYFSRGSRGLLTYVHWDVTVKHDEGLDETGVKTFDHDEAIGALEIDFPALSCTDSFHINSRGMRPLAQGYTLEGDLKGRSIVRCEPHAISSVNFVKPTKSATKKCEPP
jgi:hypothetical protein